MSDEKTFLLELREQAQQEPKLELRVLLRDKAHHIARAIQTLSEAPTRANMVTLNGLWAVGERLLMQSQERPEPEPPLAGSPEGDDVEEAA